MDVANSTRPRLGSGRAAGLAGAWIGRDFVEQFGQPLGGAGGLRELAPDFRQRAERAGGDHRIEQELAKRAGDSVPSSTLWAPTTARRRRCRRSW
jgi:hypothetical protein